MNVNAIDGAAPSLPGSTPPSRAQTAQVRQVAQAVRTLNDSSLIPADRELTMSLDPKTKIPVVKVIDAQSHQVIDQVPAEYILRLAAFLEAEAAQEGSAQQSSAQKPSP
jgi:uncharacterized FlaG/YvyC family protein